VLEYDKGKAHLRAASAKIENSVVIEPCFIGDNVVLRNSVVGPHVSLGANTKISDTIIKNSIVQQNSKINSANLQDSMIGNYVEVNGITADLNLGDHTISK